MFFCRTKKLYHTFDCQKGVPRDSMGFWGNGRATEKVILVGLLHLSVRADYEEKNQKADVTSGSLELVLQQS